jgi:hypothetical protein
VFSRSKGARLDVSFTSTLSAPLRPWRGARKKNVFIITQEGEIQWQNKL